jgi:hypothetical protein
MASNVDQYVSPAFNFDGWIEVYNPTDRAVELGGLMVSHPSTGEGPWKTPQTMGVVPAKGFGVIWFDSNNVQPNNAPFKLDVDGGTIVISDANGKEIVRQDYPASMERVSYARVEDETGEWGMTDTPTPGMTNKGIKVLKEQLAAPVVNQPSKLFTGQSGGMFMGGMMCGILMLSGLHGAVLLAMAVPLIELAAHILQRAVFAGKKKLLLKGATLHEHMRNCGWSDSRIMAVLALAQGLFCVGAAAYSISESKLIVK